jgi:hypothetical protein
MTVKEPLLIEVHQTTCLNLTINLKIILFILQNFYGTLVRVVWSTE